MNLAENSKRLFLTLLNGSMHAFCIYLDKKTDNATQNIGLTPFITSLCGNLGSDHFKEMFNLKRMEALLRSDNPTQLNHDLEHVFKAAAITAVGYVKKLLEADITAQLLSDDTIDKELLRTELGLFVNYLDKQRKWLSGNQDVLQPNLVDLDNSQGYQQQVTNTIMVFSGRFSEAQQATIRNAYEKYLPQCLQLAFHEALKEESNLKAFKAYQIKHMQESMELLRGNATALAGLQADIQKLQLAHSGVTTNLVATLFEQHRADVLHDLRPFFIDIDAKFNELISISIDTNQRVIELEVKIDELSATQYQLTSTIQELNTKLQHKERSEEDSNLIVQLTKERMVAEQALSSTKAQLEELKKTLLAFEQSKGNALLAKAQEALTAGNYEEADAYLAQETESSAHTFYIRGRVNKLNLKYQEAYKYFGIAFTLAPDNEEYLLEFSLLAEILGYYDKSKELLEKLITMHAQEDEQKAVFYNYLGVAYWNKGEYDKAIDYYNQALAIDKQYYGESHPAIATRYNNLGNAYDNKGEYDKAIDYYNQALAICKQYYGESHPWIANYYNNLGLAYNNKGEYDKAIDYHSQSLAIVKQYYGESHPSIAVRYNNLGIAYDNKGEYDKAIDYYSQSLAIDKQYYGESHPSIAGSYSNLGFACNNKGEYDKAIDYYNQALDIDKQFHREAHPQIAIRYNNLGMAYYNKGEYNKAIEYYEKALDIFLQFIDPNHPSVTNVQKKLAAAKTAKG